MPIALVQWFPLDTRRTECVAQLAASEGPYRRKLLAAMERADVPASRIYTIRDIVADAHYQARGMIREIATGQGTLKVPGVVPKLSATPGDFSGGGPALGEHSDEVLRELGYDDASINDLRARRIV